MSDNDQCPIWGTHLIDGSSNSGIVHADSPRAGGKYSIDLAAKSRLRVMDNSVKARLTTWLINQHELGIEWPEITYVTITRMEKQQSLLPRERADRLLKYLAVRSAAIGSTILFSKWYADDDDNSNAQEIQAWSESTSIEEVLFLLKYLSKCDWITLDSREDSIFYVTLTVNGYARIAELDAENKGSSQGFVAMWFPDKKNKDYDLIQKAYDEGIDPGIRQAGYDPLKINDLPHNDQITDKIISEIRRSKFLVADFTHGDTGPRGGVYYEAGFARGYNIPVIYTCLEKRFSAEKIHFDILQQNFILWTSPEDLHEKLKNRITGSEIGWGPNKLPAAV